MIWRRRRVLALLPVVAAVALVTTVCSADAADPEVELSGAQLPANDGQTEAVLYLRVANEGGGDRIVGASSPRAEGATFHEAQFEDDQVRMLPTGDIEVPHGGMTMTSGSTHVMLRGIEPGLEVGEVLPVTLELERTGMLELDVEVTSYEDAVAFLEGTQ